MDMGGPTIKMKVFKKVDNLTKEQAIKIIKLLEKIVDSYCMECEKNSSFCDCPTSDANIWVSMYESQDDEAIIRFLKFIFKITDEELK